MRILVVGGSGFLGYHIVKALLNRQHQVSLFCRSGGHAQTLFGDSVNYVHGDLELFLDINFSQCFDNIDAVVYAAGIDERTETQGDPYRFFYRENVTTCVQFIDKAKQHGVKHAVILGSIFSHFDQKFPNLKLSDNHPYIRSRTAQRDHALALISDTFQVNIAEIPFVFGISPNSSSVGKQLINYIRVATPLISINGGANAISVTSLAQGICGILERFPDSGPLPIGDVNVSWVELMQTINEKVNVTPKPIKMLNQHLLTDLTHVGAQLQDLMGIKSGLDQHHISDIITLEGYFDSQPIKEQLGYSGGDLDQALTETIKAHPESPLLSNVQRSITWFSDNTRDFIKGIDGRLSNIMDK